MSDLNLTRRHPERIRLSGEARDLPQIRSGLIVTAAIPATSRNTDSRPLATGNWTQK